MTNVRTNFIRFTLTAALLASIGGCDEQASMPAQVLDRAAAQEHLDGRDQEDSSMAPEEVQDLVLELEEATVRDIVDGRIDAPMASTDFGHLGEDGEPSELCPQQEAALSGASVDQPGDIAFDVADEGLLDTPLSEACALADHQTGGVELVRCEDHESANGSVPLDAGYDLVHLDSTAYNCYMCTSTFVCGWGGKQRKNGYILDNKCVAWGFFGCC